MVSDNVHRDRMARGSAELRRAILFARGLSGSIPAKSMPRSDLIWIEDRNCASYHAINLSASARQQAYRAGLVTAHKEAALARVVKRDPCPCCGIRQDIGCEHRRAG
jgi:hypothetical protein